MEEIKKIKFNLGLSLIGLGLILFFGRDSSSLTSTSFAEEPVRVEGISNQKEVENDNTPKRILIPDLSIDINVEKAKVVDGYWEVFEDSAGWGEGSSSPGEIGNQVIFAHARKGLFLPLRSIEAGNEIYVLSNKSWFSYKVSEIKEVLPSQTEVISPTEDETLTLYTCSGFKDTKRLLVVAKRI